MHAAPLRAPPSARVPVPSRGPRAGRRFGWILCALLPVLGGAAPRAAQAAPGTTPPTPAERVGYWLDRLLTGPEPTSWGIPKFHHLLWGDTIRNLVALGPHTLDRLADPALQARVQENRDANAWLGVLEVLGALGPQRPEVARDWAVPALTRELLPLRRAGLGVLTGLGEEADTNALLGLLERDAGDRVLGPATAKALLQRGPPHDAHALRVVYEKSPIDQADATSSIWEAWFDVLGPSGHGATATDLLVWWSLLAEGSAPLAPEVSRPGRRLGRRPDPHAMIVTPLGHAMFSGRETAARARWELARRGGATARASLAEDRAGAEPELAALAHRPFQATSREDSAAALDLAAAQARRLATSSAPPSAEEVRASVRRLAEDPSAEATASLGALLRAMPPAPAWREPLVDAYEALARRDQEDRAWAQALLASGDPSRVDLVLFLARRLASAPLRETLEAWQDTPASRPWRDRARREITYLYGHGVRQGVVAPERAAAFAARLASWAEDPDDPSAAGLAGALLELGPAGERVLAAGLAGPHRATYLTVLAQRPEHYVGLPVIEALVAPVGSATPAAERREILAAVFHAAGADAVPTLEALAHRVGPSGRADVETVLRIVRHR